MNFLDSVYGCYINTIVITRQHVNGGMKLVFLLFEKAFIHGADFIKTSTGKETVNATLPVGTVMARAIHDYFDETGCQVSDMPNS
ncbi:deoxyribose-phosphate aldolase-like [Stegodyphus dumicola]|uniref:deoxyribose-phosphate aldolase-like n=1 Tax=Stegodyphus dumicola TaxID=202533 RepID=UPI0015B2A7DC|nr:deoxyribose-phosphate aldolase-like [Stegodyphus dumicola]